MRNKIYYFINALLFTAGILIAGAECTYWPWHIPIGLALVGASSIMANIKADDTA